MSVKLMDEEGIERKLQDKTGTKEYKNKDLIVYWTPAACIHSRNCTHGLPEVFNVRKKPWIDINGASPEQIIKAIDTCPTGALKYKVTENSSVDKKFAAGPGSVDYVAEKDVNVEIRLVKDGPLIVDGPVRLIDAEGVLIGEKQQTALCRCGKTKKPPFCDGSHTK